MAELEDVVEDCRRHGGDASLVFMDLNRPKMLNDSHGHQAGDAAIVHVARINRESLHGGFAARFGGDESALVIRNLTEAYARARAASIADRIARPPLFCDGIERSDGHTSELKS